MCAVARLVVTTLRPMPPDTDAPAPSVPLVDAAPRVRGTRTPREEGRERMLEATVELLRTRRPDEVTVRDVAAACGHGHRLVQAWFGGKVGLFREAFDRMIADTADRVQGPAGSGLEGPGLPPDLLALVGLMNWLVAASPGSLDAPRATPIIDRLVDIYRERYALDDEVARLMALRLVAGVIAVTLFPGPLGIRGDDITALGALETELVELLADARAPD